MGWPGHRRLVWLVNKDIIGYCSAIAQARRMLKMGIISLDDYEKIDHDWKVDVVLSHTTPLKYEPVEVFLPQIDQSQVDKSTEIWLDSIGYLLTFDRLIDTSPDSGLVFRPLSPMLENKLYLVWEKYQALSPIAARFLKRLQTSFAS